ncbi:phosphoenolpyruvate hydrolase family protein [Alsobacter sp. SYSU M60028]|uniref:Phosphoenolpyruvate hydrolase family protein n=1 Tax=Alsobacter ponti TaxID=2962936 RepID=A0ABT1LEX1_9HYPH|nr:phosphoenolpyruvate hydrolase family protein [Alsobacter ponti]MCP8939673.1 phosphoenolpyruvate hydrolase family protein [Alsobacter ponti]
MSDWAGRAAPIFDHIPEATEPPPDGPVLVCPWMAGLTLPSGPWLAVLPIHDANAWIDDDAWPGPPAAFAERLYFGIYAQDRLRAADRMLARLAAKGVRGLVNLPTVSFFDGSAAANHRALDFTPQRELEFLLRGRDAGFRAGFCTRAPEALTEAERAELDFLLVPERTGGPLLLARASGDR